MTLRQAWTAEDWQQLRRLADAQEVAALPPSTALFVAAALLRAQAPDEAIKVLEFSQREQPDDFWLNHRLAYTLQHCSKRQEEAVGYYRAALALRPQSAGVYVNLSGLLEGLGRYDEAEAAARKAVRLLAYFGESYANLSYFLRRRRDDWTRRTYLYQEAACG